MTFRSIRVPNSVLANVMQGSIESFVGEEGGEIRVECDRLDDRRRLLVVLSSNSPVFI